jgi:hypothetical protein
MLEYLLPLRGFISEKDMDIKKAELVNKSQAIVRSGENMVGLIHLIRKDWFPESYRITTVEEINSIGFMRHSEYRSLTTFARNYENFIIDWSFPNKIRARNSGFRENDSMYMLELLQEVNMQRGKKVIIVLNPNVRGFIKNYRELCEGFDELGINYFNKGKYHQFVSDREDGVNE